MAPGSAGTQVQVHLREAHRGFALHAHPPGHRYAAADGQGDPFDVRAAHLQGHSRARVFPGGILPRDQEVRSRRHAAEFEGRRRASPGVPRV